MSSKTNAVNWTSLYFIVSEKKWSWSSNNQLLFLRNSSIFRIFTDNLRPGYLLILISRLLIFGPIHDFLKFLLIFWFLLIFHWLSKIFILVVILTILGYFQVHFNVSPHFQSFLKKNNLTKILFLGVILIILGLFCALM